MALKKCRECSKEISSSVSKCPQCGAPQSQLAQGCAGVVGLVVLAFGAYSIFGSHELPKNTAVTFTPDQVEHAVSQVDIARHDPAKQKIFECMGVKVYKDPQPPGHPPSQEECSQIMRRASSQSKPPDYAAEERRTAGTEYMRERDAFIGEIRQMYFAVGCGVFASEAGVLPYISARGDTIQQDAISNVPAIIDTKAQYLMHEAAQQGLARATNAGECDYWKQNPDALHEVVRKAQIAAEQQ